MTLPFPQAAQIGGVCRVLPNSSIIISYRNNQSNFFSIIIINSYSSKQLLLLSSTLWCMYVSACVCVCLWCMCACDWPWCGPIVTASCISCSLTRQPVLTMSINQSTYNKRDKFTQHHAQPVPKLLLSRSKDWEKRQVGYGDDITSKNKQPILLKPNKEF